MKACKFHLPFASSSSSISTISSLLFEPATNSLALMHSDSSVHLFSSLPVQSSAPLPPSTNIPPLSTSSCCFLRLHTARPPQHVIFLSASPHGCSVLLRGWIRHEDVFSPLKLRSRKEDSAERGFVVGVKHGFSVAIAGSVNVFVLHSTADKKILVFAARMGEEGDCVDLIKCAVIELVLPVYTVKVSPGFLILGEVFGIRVFPLRPLVKGRVGKRRDLSRRVGVAGKVEQKKKKLPNGVVINRGFSHCDDDSGHCDQSVTVNNCNKGRNVDSQMAELSSRDNGGGETINEEHSSTKLRTVKLKQNSSDLSSTFVGIKASEVQSPNSKTVVVNSLKVVAVHALSLKKFLILDSVGDLHLLIVQYGVLDSEVRNHTFSPSLNTLVRRLDCSMKVQMLAVHPEPSLRTHNVWISDACYSLHMASLADIETSADENNLEENREKLTQLLATETVFTSEKIHDIVPLASNAALVLGQGNMFAYVAA